MRVLVRTQDREEEKIASKFLALTEFTSAIPQTVRREVTNLTGMKGKVFNGEVDVQERIGKSVHDRPEIIKQVDTDPQLRDQVEQATVMRMIIGDADDQITNMAVSKRW